MTKQCKQARKNKRKERDREGDRKQWKKGNGKAVGDSERYRKWRKL